MKTAIVTGAAGFIGRAITEKPAERGALVSALDRNAGKLAVMALREGVTAVPADLENGVRGSLLREADALFHCACARAWIFQG